MLHLTTITGKKLRVSANHSKRHFTIRTECAKYRTIQMSVREFESNINNTGNDWQQFLRGSDYYKI